MAGWQDKVVYQTDAKISSRREKIELRIKKANADLAKLQQECSHENVIKKHRGSTGNYDPSEDCFWIDHSCLECGKRWTETLDK